MIHLELLVEDRSGGLYLFHLMESLLQNTEYQNQVQLHLRPHRGSGGFHFDWKAKPQPGHSALLSLLPAKFRAHAALGESYPCVLVVVMDSDDHPVGQLVQGIAKMAGQFAGPVPVVIGIAVEELEAWALGDWQAIQEAYPDAAQAVYQTYQQDSICGTWECLARILLPEDKAEALIQLGYPAAGQMKHQWASTIAPHLSASRNRSPSFRVFQKKIMQALHTALGAE